MAKNNKSSVVKENTQTQDNDVVVDYTITENKLQEEAKKLMQKHDVETVYATEDGNLFLPHNKQHAIEHAHKTQQELLTINKQ